MCSKKIPLFFSLDLNTFTFMSEVTLHSGVAFSYIFFSYFHTIAHLGSIAAEFHRFGRICGARSKGQRVSEKHRAAGPARGADTRVRWAWPSERTIESHC